MDGQWLQLGLLRETRAGQKRGTLKIELLITYTRLYRASGSNFVLSTPLT